MSSGTTTLIAPTTTLSDNASAVTNIGFDFWFMGTRYTQFSANCNGLMRLGSTVVSTVFSNDLNGTADLPMLTAFWDDFGCASPIIAKIHYKLTGTAPNRVLTIEWKDFLLVYSATAGSSSTFQVRLSEFTGTIEYIYGAMNNATTAAVTTASIGFSAANANNSLLSVTDISTPAVTTATASVNDLLVNNSTDGAITGLNSAADGSRTLYTFSQTAPTAPTALTFTNVLTTSVDLNWTDNATNECGYVIYSSTDGVTYTFNQQVVAGSITASVTGLSTNTAYYFKVYAVREGALSTALSGSQKTATTATINSPTATWLSPCGVTSVVVECWGGGGAGGGNSTTADGGGGGGGGAYSKSTLAVTAGTTYNVSVGTGGTGVVSAAGNPGGDTWFNTSGTILAKGGTGGNPPVAGAGGTAGTGGAAGSGVGTTKYSGANGGAGKDHNTGVGGSGGTSAGTGANGNPGAVGSTTNVTAPAGGGDSGGGGGADANGVAGTVPGGGGGGSGDNVTGSRTGGDGANGKIIITYVDYIPTITLGASPSICLGTTSANLPYSATVNSPNQYSINYDATAEAQGFVDVALTALPSTPITLTLPGGAVAGTYNATITVKNTTTGCSGSATAFTITIDPAATPVAAGTITGTAYICQSQSGVAYSVPAITNATSYTWTYSGTGATINGTTNSITIDFNASATSGNLTVAGTRACGSGTVSANYAIGVMDPPAIVTNPTSTYGCNGTSLTFSMVATGAGLTYQWQEFIAGWLNITDGGVYSGATTETLTISNPAGFNGRQYRCVITGQCSPTATTTSATLNVLGSGLSGTKNVGTGGDYTTLKAAFDAINANGLIGNLDLRVITDITETAAAQLDQWNSCGNSG